MTNPIVHSFVLSKSVSSLGTILKIYVEHCVVSNFNFTINENFHFLQKIPGKISNERSWGKGGRGSNLHSLKASSNNNGSLSFRTRKKAEVKGVPTFHDTHIYTNETFNPDNVI